MKNYTPTSPGRRFQSTLEYSELTKKKPEKGLVYFLHRSGGRNNAGLITTDHRGGGAPRKCEASMSGKEISASSRSSSLGSFTSG